MQEHTAPLDAVIYAKGVVRLCQEDTVTGVWKQANIAQPRPFLGWPSCRLLDLTLILGRIFVTRILGSMCASAPSLVSLGDLADPHGEINLPPLGVQGSLMPLRLPASLRADLDCAEEGSDTAPAGVMLAPAGRDLMVTGASDGESVPAPAVWELATFSTTFDAHDEYASCPGWASATNRHSVS